MRWIGWIVLAAVAAVGCGARTPPTNNGGIPGAEGNKGAFAPEPPAPVVVLTPAQVAANYEQQLAGQDATTRQQAAQALRGLGEEGYAALLRSIRNGTPEAKQEALQALDTNLLNKHAARLLPVLSPLLRDRSATLRALAASRLGALGKPAAEVIPELKRLAKSDDNAQVRGACDSAVVVIEYAVRGGPDPAMLPKPRPKP